MGSDRIVRSVFVAPTSSKKSGQMPTSETRAVIFDGCSIDIHLGLICCITFSLKVLLLRLSQLGRLDFGVR